MRSGIGVWLVIAVAAAAASSVGAAGQARCAPGWAAATVDRSGTCIVGTDRADRLVGSPGADVIYGWAGADRILGGAGDDRLYAGSDDDVVLGGAGDDVIDPALGRDVVYGGAGTDVIRTRGGEPDRVSCGAGYDRAEVDRLDVVARDCEQVLVAHGYGTRA